MPDKKPAAVDIGWKKPSISIPLKNLADRHFGHAATDHQAKRLHESMIERHAAVTDDEAVAREMRRSRTAFYRRRYKNETDISTFSNQAEAQAWISGSLQHTRRPIGHQKPSS
jgi:beta-lactamase class D